METPANQSTREISPDQLDSLLAAALRIREQAYAPYSGFLVGAALLDSSGAIHVGCNVENASYGLSVCAERHAVAAMVAAAERKIHAIAVASTGSFPPCGACRQVLSEFAEEATVWLVDANSKEVTQTVPFADLLPGAFGAKFLES